MPPKGRSRKASTSKESKVTVTATVRPQPPPGGSPRPREGGRAGRVAKPARGGAAAARAANGAGGRGASGTAPTKPARRGSAKGAAAAGKVGGKGGPERRASAGRDAKAPAPVAAKGRARATAGASAVPPGKKTTTAAKRRPEAAVDKVAAAGGPSADAAATKVQAAARGKRDRAKVQEIKEQNAAATKVQAVHRGRTDRARVAELKSGAASKPSAAPAAPGTERAGSAEDAAATKVQAAARGKRDRAAVAELKHQHVAATKVQAVQRGRADRSRVSRLRAGIADDAAPGADATAKPEGGASSSATPEDAAATRVQAIARGNRDRAAVEELKAQNQAATTVQAVQRGRAGRARVAQMKSGEVGGTEGSGTAGATDSGTSEDVAATKVQAIARGKRDRAKVEQLRREDDAATKLQAVERGRRDRIRVAAMKADGTNPDTDAAATPASLGDAGSDANGRPNPLSQLSLVALFSADVKVSRRDLTVTISQPAADTLFVDATVPMSPLRYGGHCTLRWLSHHVERPERLRPLAIPGPRSARKVVAAELLIPLLTLAEDFATAEPVGREAIPILDDDTVELLPLVRVFDDAEARENAELGLGEADDDDEDANDDDDDDDDEEDDAVDVPVLPPRKAIKEGETFCLKGAHVGDDYAVVAITTTGEPPRRRSGEESSRSRPGSATSGAVLLVEATSITSADSFVGRCTLGWASQGRGALLKQTEDAKRALTDEVLARAKLVAVDETSAVDVVSEGDSLELRRVPNNPQTTSDAGGAADSEPVAAGASS